MQIVEVFESSLQKLSINKGSREDRNILSLIFEDLLQLPDQSSEHIFPTEKIEILEEAIIRLNSAEPVQYITGVAHFYGYKFSVSPSVLIPRMETEELVFEAIQFLNRNNNNNPKILDVGTGSGCIAICLKKQFPDARVFGVDLSERALEVAVDNARQLDVSIEFLHWNLLQPNTWSRFKEFDVVVSNPPYIAMSEKAHMPDQVLKFEPAVALYAPNNDPVLIYQTLFKFAEHTLVKGGGVLAEINEFWSEQIMAELSRISGMEMNLLPDMQGKDRIVFATKN